MNRVVEATDLEAVRQLLSGAYGPMRIDASGDLHRLRLSQLWVGSVRLDQVRFAMDGEAEAEPAGALIFGHVTSGSVSFGSAGSERSLGPGDVFLAAQPEHRYTARIRHTHAELAVVDPSLANQVAITALGYSPEPVRFTGYHSVSAQAARSWKRTYAYARSQAKSSPGVAAHPLLAGNAARLLVAAALTTFPNNAMTGPALSDRHDASAATMRRAVFFIDDHARQDMSAADIAAAVHVSVRALQLAFRRHLDTTPMNYLRRVRLAGAHHQLQTADPARTTVTAIASSWGFTSPGRFTAYYRATYGVRPSDTLHG